MYRFHEVKTLNLNTLGNLNVDERETALTLESPASEAIIEFRQQRPLSVFMDDSVVETLEQLHRHPIKVALVFSKDQSFKGLVSAADLDSRKVISRAVNLGIKRSELTAGEVMTPQSRLRGVTFKTLKEASVGDLLETLKTEGSQYMLILDDRSEQIAGLVSSSRIARRLGQGVQINPLASTFTDVVSVVHGREVV